MCILLAVYAISVDSFRLIFFVCVCVLPSVSRFSLLCFWFVASEWYPVRHVKLHCCILHFLSLPLSLSIFILMINDESSFHSCAIQMREEYKIRNCVLLNVSFYSHSFGAEMSEGWRNKRSSSFELIQRYNAGGKKERTNI